MGSLPYAGEIYSTACAVLWAVALILFAISGRSVPPAALNVFKNTLAAPLILLTMIVLEVPILPNMDAFTFGVLAFSGFFGITLGDTLVFASLNRVGAGWTAVVDTSYSPLVILVTAVFFGVPLTLAVAIGTAAIVVAILLASGRPRAGARPTRVLVTGLLLGILSQAAMAIGVSVLKYPIFGHAAVFDVAGVLTVTFWRLVIGTALLAAWMALRSDRRHVFGAMRPSPAWRTMVPGAFLASYVAMILWIAGMKEITGSITRAAILNQTSAVLLPALGVVFLHERLGLRKALAIAVAIAGAAIVILGRP